MKLIILLACLVIIGKKDTSMLKILIFELIFRLFLFLAATTCSAQLIFTSCARMNDGPVGAKVAQAACISSCKFQNCGTGKCEYRGRPVCVCARCDKGGGEWPNIPVKGK